MARRLQISDKAAIGYGFLLFLLLPSVGFPVETWKRWEQSLTSNQSYTNPYADVILSVTYTGPGGQVLGSYGFWDGSNIWKIRCAFPAAGNWTWQTASSPNDASLNQQGSLVVTPYRGTNLLYAKGFLKVSSNHRYLTHGDGTPFFWVGDTPWSAALNATDADWQSYVSARASQRFNLLQMAPAPVWAGTADRKGNWAFVDSNSNGLPDEIIEWNPVYWQGFEQKVDWANQAGLVVFLCGVMEPLHDPVHHQVLPDTRQAQLFARNIVARLFGNHVLFSPSFDSGHQSSGPNPYSHGRAVGEAIRSASERHLISNHPQSFLPMMKQWHDSGQSYADFTGLQTGHGWVWTNLCSPAQVDGSAFAAFTMTRELYDYTQTSTKPLINMEPRYLGPWLEAYLPRLSGSCGYWSVLNGTAGVTYGIAGIWNWGTNFSATAGLPCDDDWTWEQGRDAQCAGRISHFAEFFAAHPWWTLVPASELIKNQAASTDYVKKMAFAKSASGNLAMAYLPDNAEIQLDLSSFPALMKATWFNCVTGAYSPGPAEIINRGRQILSRPTPGEWGLVLEPARTANCSL